MRATPGFLTLKRAQRYRCALYLASAALLVGGLPVLAHHSGAAVFDNSKKLNLTGVVTKVDWTNPHAHFFMDVKDAAGKVTNWNFELASPSILIRNGWSRHSLKEGDTVTVTGSQARDNTTLGIAQSIVFPDGHKLNFLSAYEDSK
jgi:hypothetical protein